MEIQVTMRSKETVDQAWLRKFVQEVRQNKTHLHVGVLDATPHASTQGMSVADIAATHELGSGNIPARPWLLGFFNEKEADVNRMLGASVNNTGSKREDLAHMLGVFGSLIVSGIRKRMTAGIDPELAPLTLKLRQAKGVSRTTPLIDTGQLINSIAIKVFGKKKQVP